MGCGDRLPSDLSACGDADCQTRWVEARWASDPKGVEAALGALPDPIVRVSLVRTLTTAHPGEALPLCDLLPRGPAQLDCRSRNHRPHLLSQVPAGGTKSAEDAGDGGPESHGLTPSHALTSPWAETAAETTPCAAEARVCQAQAASSRASEGNTAAAAAACNGIEAGPWREECYFQAGEAAVRTGAADDAVSLCMAAGTYAGRCLSHVVREVGALAPVASTGDATAWARISAAIAGTEGVLRAQDPDLARRFADQSWAWGAGSAYSRSAVVTGAPLAFVPAEAAPHVRAAAAWQLWSQERNQERSFADWAARLDEVLADRAPRATGRALGRPPVHGMRELWSTLLPGEEALASRFYLGARRRAVVEDAATDGRICLLEAMGHAASPPLPLLEAGLTDADPTVRWTAARLLAALSPGDPQLHASAHDPDPLVRARAEPGGRNREGKTAL